MYENFYGIREKPFALLPDPSFLYMSKGHSAALTLLRYSIMSRQAFSVVTGEIGSGKTTLVNQILSEMEDDITVGVISFTHQDSSELGEWVLMAFGLEYRGKSKAELYDDFINFLIREYAQGRRTILIIDEAQNMQASGLENVRMLSNVNASKEYLLHLILVGQPELREMLQQQGLRQLAQRVSAAYHLEPLSVKEAREYIKYRLQVAGATESIFSPKAKSMIAEASGGVPRVINTICDLALVYGYSAGRKIIDVRIVKSVLEDRRKMGLLGAAPLTQPGVGAV